MKMGTGTGGDCPDQGLFPFCAGASPHFLIRIKVIPDAGRFHQPAKVFLGLTDMNAISRYPPKWARRGTEKEDETWL